MYCICHIHIHASDPVLKLVPCFSQNPSHPRRQRRSGTRLQLSGQACQRLRYITKVLGPRPQMKGMCCFTWGATCYRLGRALNRRLRGGGSWGLPVGVRGDDRGARGPWTSQRWGFHPSRLSIREGRLFPGCKWEVPTSPGRGYLVMRSLTMRVGHSVQCLQNLASFRKVAKTSMRSTKSSRFPKKGRMPTANTAGFRKRRGARRASVLESRKKWE